MKTGSESAIVVNIVFFVETINPDLEKMLRDKVFARNNPAETEKNATAKRTTKRKKKPAKR